MVCPNCHSKQVIAVQDQHFCIDCGQVVPEAPVKKTVSPAGVAVQDNGLPEGVKILPVAASLGPPPKAETPATPEAPEAPVATPESTQEPAAQIVQSRNRLGTSLEADEDKPKTKKRKPGRPKAGKLDVPAAIAIDTPAPLPSAPALGELPPADAPLSGPRRMSDIAPRRPAHRAPHHAEAKPEEAPAPTPHATTHTPAKKKDPKAHKVHKVGVPPLHYGAVLAFSLRARVRPRLLALASLAAVSFAAVTGYGVWMLLTGGLSNLASGITKNGTQAAIELGVLAVIYYVGRSIGQSAITYGVARDADQRPVTLTRQIAVAVNTFSQRLALDLGFGLIELALIGVMALLVMVGGADWPVNPQIQLAALFLAFLVLLYLLSSVALSRGLAAVALTLTARKPLAAAKLGWRLFSHRFELLGLRFLALAIEITLAIPLAVLGVAFVTSASPHLYLAVAIGAGLIAWLAGALIGSGTASWWTVLYRNLVHADHPDDTASMLSGRQAQEARSGSLAFVVALSTFLVAAVLALPWLKFF